MATKSILKDINIKDKATLKKLLYALDNVSDKSDNATNSGKTFTELFGSDIVKMFEDKN